MDWNLLWTAIGAGLLYSLSGYAKNIGETWNWLKFGRTIIIGIAVGVFMAWQGYDIETSHSILLSLGAIPLIDNILKAAYRRIIQ